MNYILFDLERERLLPLTFTRPVAELRIGILTIREKWEKMLAAETSTLTVDYLQTKFPLVQEQENLLINGGVCPNNQLVDAILKLNVGEQLVKNGLLLAAKVSGNASADHLNESAGIEFEGDVLSVRDPWDIFSKNGEALTQDFELLTSGRKSMPLSNSNTVIGNGKIFLEEGAKAEACIFNTTSGPIYLGKDSEVMEGSVIRGPFALCEGSQVKLSTKIYGPTTVGPHSKVGGEVNNSVIIGYSNKGHDGFLGNSVLGEWCNLGADTNNSNLKNNYDQVRVWNYAEQRFAKTGLQFCGLIMGDHSKSGINTMFNTGTVVGVSSNVFGSGFPRTFIPSFQWGGASGFVEYDKQKAFATAERVMSRRGLSFDDTEKAILSTVYDLTKSYRN
ncbi:MAG: GlmU family protein [Flavobacteriales bacterium]|nr:GlmU family protein [Flavobacteriales bacterium]MCB9192024.1 GlmU family protein [Flavobacteriales bacterium]MCB9204084.1 GlmU family protein [Flavobacteriales bacterium]